MATTGSIDFNLDKISNIINNSTEVGAGITEGIADEASSMGTAIGITITVVFYILLITTILGIVFLIFRFVSKLLKTKLK